MYRYDEFDHAMVSDRVNQFRGQVARRLSGDLTEDQFKPLRLQNGLYLQLHAYMLRVAIPYGQLNARQMRMLAHIARKYDRGYGHFTTRQNIQYNWPKLEDTPDILDDLASVEMHAIQTSGNTIRNVTADQYAGVAADEIDGEDPRVYAEIIRQWSTFHPEFAFLPRKFKIAVSAAQGVDRAAVRFHDIGLFIVKNDDGETGFEVWVGGGLGRTPMVAKKVRDFVAKPDLLAYLEAILRVYNLEGRRDNMYKARIKILVHETGVEKFSRLVEEEFAATRGGDMELPAEEVARIRDYFAPPVYEALENDPRALTARRFEHKAFNDWVRVNTVRHKAPGYAIANISLKPVGLPPGDISADQMDAVADLADEFSMAELRATHEQNLVLPDVRQDQLYDLWLGLQKAGLADANLDHIGDVICCPGLDYCALANARSIPVAERITRRFADLDRQYEIGELRLKISGCINACGHHHVGHIGILGVDRKDQEYYQITLGGAPGDDAAIGNKIGAAFSSDEVVDAVETILMTYLAIRRDGERFIDTHRRVGDAPFKEKLYDKAA
jgi:sulfite reductase (NADPH) hemoprotein beta-component